MKLDMTMMITFHDALRRDLERLARLTARTGDDPRHLLRSAAGWEMFKRYLHIHHSTEDAFLWPVMQAALAGRSAELALLAAMEDEHAAIDPLLAAVDAALADRDSGHERLGDLVDALGTVLTGHLKHEESETLALIDVTLTEEQWRRFGKEHSARVGDDAPRFLPWVLDGASPATTAAVLTPFPEPIRAAYQGEWLPAYERAGVWPAAQPGRRE
ncbi:hemerythrin domain-containing protein [Nonomuraea sp. NPDC050790]|uniref:hemerythrin domain-containing protein n=1 Tax=Nonomuraea sp. NPDC050790 TaxID=3364371 RepID=UPI0037AE89CA